MTKQNKSTEELFKEAFNGFQAEPSKAVWSKVNRGLWFQSIIGLKGLPVLTVVLLIIAILLVSKERMTQNKAELIHEMNLPAKQDGAPASESEATLFKEDSSTKNADTLHIATGNPKNTKMRPEAPSVNIEATEMREIASASDPLNVRHITLTDSTNNNLLQIPSAAFTGSRCEGCAPLTVHFSANSSSDINSRWDFGDSQTAFGKQTSHTFTEAGQYTVVHTASVNGLNGRQQTTVTVYESPDADFIIEHQENIHSGQAIRFANLSTDGDFYYWTFGDGNRSEVQNPTHTFNTEGIYDISLRVQSEEGCQDSTIHKSIIVKSSKYNIQFPNAFSPSKEGPVSGSRNVNDHSNDVFYPVSSAEIEAYKLTVYNQKGLKLFETDDYNEGWNGYYRNRLMPEGVYVYLCSGKFSDGEYFRKSGNITLLHQTR